MDQFDPKHLAKLASACRKAGIKSFKGYGMEFTLTDEIPQKSRRSAKGQIQASKVNHGEQGEIETDEPTENDILFWSSAQGIDTEEDSTQ